MHTALLETQPRDNGDKLSWFHFLNNRVVTPTKFESFLGLTVSLSDIISNFRQVALAIDPSVQHLLVRKEGFLFPSFSLRFIGRDFEIETEKIFAGGSNRNCCLNYKVNIIIYSRSRDRVRQLLEMYKGFGSMPVYSFTNH
jgi:hypothetical protein